MSDDWKKDPRLSQVDPQKLSMLQNLAGSGIGGKILQNCYLLLWKLLPGEKMPGLNFSSHEISTIIEVIKMGKNPADAARLDRIVNLMKMIQH